MMGRSNADRSKPGPGSGRAHEGSNPPGVDGVSFSTSDAGAEIKAQSYAPYWSEKQMTRKRAATRSRKRARTKKAKRRNETARQGECRRQADRGKMRGQIGNRRSCMMLSYR